MPDLRSLEERIAEVVRDELERESVKVCCQDFEHCTTPCTVRANYWKAVAETATDGIKYWKEEYRRVISEDSPSIEPDTQWPHKSSEPQPSQKAPSSPLSSWQLQALPGILLVVAISSLAAIAVIAGVHLCR